MEVSMKFYSEIKKYYENFRIMMKEAIKYENTTRNYMVVHSKGLVYLINPKVACSSIQASINSASTSLTDDGVAAHRAGTFVKELSGIEKKYYKFTIVRNPFQRLVSCYENKYHNDKEYSGKKEKYYDYYLFGILKKDRGFADFVKRVCVIPNKFADRHFCSQYDLIYRDGICLVDFIGKFERIEEDYKIISDKFSLPPLPHFNQSGKNNWMDYYTIDLAHTVFRKYEKDIKHFQYVNEYRKLIKYLKNKGLSK